MWLLGGGVAMNDRGCTHSTEQPYNLANCIALHVVWWFVGSLVPSPFPAAMLSAHPTINMAAESGLGPEYRVAKLKFSRDFIFLNFAR